MTHFWQRPPNFSPPEKCVNWNNSQRETKVRSKSRPMDAHNLPRKPKSSRNAVVVQHVHASRNIKRDTFYCLSYLIWKMFHRLSLTLFLAACGWKLTIAGLLSVSTAASQDPSVNTMIATRTPPHTDKKKPSMCTIQKQKSSHWNACRFEEPCTQRTLPLHPSFSPCLSRFLMLHPGHPDEPL